MAMWFLVLELCKYYCSLGFWMGTNGIFQSELNVFTTNSKLSFKVKELISPLKNLLNHMK